MHKDYFYKFQTCAQNNSLYLGRQRAEFQESPQYNMESPPPTEPIDLTSDTENSKHSTSKQYIADSTKNKNEPVPVVIPSNPIYEPDQGGRTIYDLEPDKNTPNKLSRTETVKFGIKNKQKKIPNGLCFFFFIIFVLERRESLYQKT